MFLHGKKLSVGAAYVTSRQLPLLDPLEVEAALCQLIDSGPGSVSTPLPVPLSSTEDTYPFFILLLS